MLTGGERRESGVATGARCQSGACPGGAVVLGHVRLQKRTAQAHDTHASQCSAQIRPLILCSAMADLAAARAYLRGSDSAAAPVSIHDHLQALLLKIVQEKPARPLQQFEALSVQIKQERFKQQQKQRKEKEQNGAAAVAAPAASVPSGGILGLDVPHPPFFSSDSQKAALASYIQKVQDRIKKPKKFNEDGEEEEEEEVEMNPLSPDLQQESFLLQQAGMAGFISHTPTQPTNEPLRYDWGEF